MNLHIVPDNTFINKFFDNLNEIGLAENNKLIVRTNEQVLKSVRHNLPFAPLYSSRFASLVGNTGSYEKVFIHYFSPLLYRWVASSKFNEVNWMVWGGDLYNLPSLDRLCYERMTWDRYMRKDWSAQTLLYKLKINLTQTPFQKKAYAKIKNILTWMDEEYKFAIEHLPVQADYQFFFYENQLPYSQLDALVPSVTSPKKRALIIGNSASPTNNHLDTIRVLENNHIDADLFVPVSYGDKRYISFLKNNLKFSRGNLEFIERYMPFDEYLNFLSASDGLIMNTIRPQGFGNILMMMYLGKPVFFNPNNISLPDLNRAGLKWSSLDTFRSFTDVSPAPNKEGVMRLLSHGRLVQAYKELFR